MELQRNKFITSIDSPIGRLFLECDDDALTKLVFNKDRVEGTPTDHAILQKTILQLQEYFDGNRMEFELEIRPEGTNFQKAVWDELLRIPLGKSISYLDLAKKMGSHLKSRAVANANALNPISIIIPCHRVIGSDGSLTGYAGGLNNKRWLLEHEGVLPKGLF